MDVLLGHLNVFLESYFLQLLLMPDESLVRMDCSLAMDYSSLVVFDEMSLNLHLSLRLTDLFLDSFLD